MNINRFTAAFELALQVHLRQEVAQSGAPTLGSSAAVMSLVLKVGGSEEQMLAALLLRVFTYPDMVTHEQLHALIGEEPAAWVKACHNARMLNPLHVKKWDADTLALALAAVKGLPEEAKLLLVADMLEVVQTLLWAAANDSEVFAARHSSRLTSYREYFERVFDLLPCVYPGNPFFPVLKEEMPRFFKMLGKRGFGSRKADF